MTIHELSHSLQEGMHSIFVKGGISTETDEKCHSYARSLSSLSPEEITDEMRGLLNEAKIEVEKSSLITTGVIMNDLAELTIKSTLD
jgi:hypothetical protein